MRELFLESVDSTNSFLKRHYGEYDDMTFLSAEVQTAGRGRLGRQWDSGAGKDLTFSLLIKDRKLIEAHRILSVCSAYSVIKVMEGYGIADLGLKWPNDVFVGNAKICGILLEAVSRQQMECLVIGIGVNVNSDLSDKSYIHEAISMKTILKRDIDLQGFRSRLYRQLSDDISRIRDGYDLYPKISGYDMLKGRYVYCLLGGIKKKVMVLGIDRDFSLKISFEGKTMNIGSDEITFHA